MKKQQSRPSAPNRISASALVQMGVCERLMVFEHQHGLGRTRVQRQAMWRGLSAHLRFYRDGHPQPEIGRRIATLLYLWGVGGGRGLWVALQTIGRWAFSRSRERGDGR